MEHYFYLMEKQIISPIFICEDDDYKDEHYKKEYNVIIKMAKFIAKKLNLKFETLQDIDREYKDVVGMEKYKNILMLYFTDPNSKSTITVQANKKIGFHELYNLINNRIKQHRLQVV